MLKLIIFHPFYHDKEYYTLCISVQGTPILVYLTFLVNQHVIFIDIQTILPNIVNIELLIFHVKIRTPIR